MTQVPIHTRAREPRLLWSDTAQERPSDDIFDTRRTASGSVERHSPAYASRPLGVGASVPLPVLAPESAADAMPRHAAAGDADGTGEP